MHTNAGDTHAAYNTDPPTSGPHFPTVPRRGTYAEPLATEFLPHFMEHAGVIVQYNSSASPAVVAKLKEIVKQELNRSSGLVLMAPRPAMPCQVALTAWQRIEVFGASKCQPGWVGHELDPGSSKDIQLVKEFIERNQCAYDPENQCGSGQHGDLKYPTLAPGQTTVVAGFTPQPATSPSATPAR